MYKIYQLCGKKDYNVKFDREIDLDKVKELFNGFNEIERSKDMIGLKKDDKRVYIFSYGEILFLNFDIKEIEEILKMIENIL